MLEAMRHEFVLLLLGELTGDRRARPYQGML